MLFSRSGIVAALALIALVGVAPTARAQIVQYTFPGATPSLAATTTDPNVLASNVNFAGSGASQFSLANAVAVNVATGANSAATAVSTNSYFQFTVTPLAGSAMNLTSLTIDAAVGPPPPSGVFFLRSSADGFAADIPGSSFTIPTVYSTFTNFNIDLTASVFQNLSAPTTFRIYTYLASGSNPASVFDNVTLNGTAARVTVPEPGTLLLLSTGLLGLAGAGARTVRRRRVKAA